jgi:hypothetical protein
MYKIIYVKKEDEKITLTQEEFEKYLKEAYDNGFQDGKQQNTVTLPGWEPGMRGQVNNPNSTSGSPVQRDFWYSNTSEQQRQQAPEAYLNDPLTSISQNARGSAL